ncbi:DUF6191 domain-containing protein [Streptomyces sp. RY43-2]|uniref:DUF6191 domain-containing protein n=1 Tax=Streptomyces macrolidinus TaxID=2952607 RepID=A0ABT0Z9M0_9ACTN|nr:DUF6191 domain-containing protein [Streptomyces macrolidinus]MCN9240266.1 DUF6191 domain-containing protein [Streptomyces macrolidinus]
MFNLFEELFAQGRKHTHDEKRRLELSRVDVTDGDPGRGPIDLASGKVLVRPPKPDQPDQPDRSDRSDRTDRSDQAAADPEASPD